MNSERLTRIANCISSVLHREYAASWPVLEAFPSTGVAQGRETISGLPESQAARLIDIIGRRGAQWFFPPPTYDFSRTAEQREYMTFYLKRKRPTEVVPRVKLDPGRLKSKLTEIVMRRLETHSAPILSNDDEIFYGRCFGIDVGVTITYQLSRGRLHYGVACGECFAICKKYYLPYPAYENLLGLGTGDWDRLPEMDSDAIGLALDSAIEHSIELARKIEE